MFLKTIKQVITSLLSNKMRSFLTMLGVVIGVAAVIIIMSLGSGAQSLILAQVESLGSDIVAVLPGSSDSGGPPASAMGIVITTLVYDDYLNILSDANVPNALAAVAYSNGAGALSYGIKNYNTSISGCTHDYIKVEGGELEVGRFITESEEKNMSKVVVLGSTVKEELFGDTTAIGKKIKIKKHIFEVIGVMEARGKVAFQDFDDKVFIPLKTMQKIISGNNYLGMLRTKVDNKENLEKMIDDIKATIRSGHNIKNQTGIDDDFSVRSAAQAMDMVTVITDSLRYFLGAMAAMSLVVGGIGIMNIMLVTVNRRTREIGLRKALGATNSNIVNQFLIETVIITGIGGVFGIIFGVLISFIVSVVINLLDYEWEFSISIESVLAGLFVSLFVGLVFGLYPARKASKLEPVEALRYE